jgi:hypothetical protein
MIECLVIWSGDLARQGTTTKCERLFARSPSPSPLLDAAARFGIQKGLPSVPSDRRRALKAIPPPADPAYPVRYCGCGCRTPIPIATRGGQQAVFVAGHSRLGARARLARGQQGAS